ncbi:MAG: FMN-binding protein [Marinifilaceae bacterium]
MSILNWLKKMPSPNYRKLGVSVLVIGIFSWLAWSNPFVKIQKLSFVKKSEIEKYESLDSRERIQNHLKQNLDSDLHYKIEEKDGISYAQFFNSEEEFCGLYFETFDLAKVKGYNGPVNLGVRVYADGTIESVEHVYSRETKAYIKRINRSGYFAQYVGLNLSDSNHQVDALSGATITTVAVAHTLENAIRKATPVFLSDYLEGTSSFGVKASLNSWWYLHILLIGGLMLVGWPGLFRKRKWLRLLMYACSVLYLGFFLKNTFSYVILLQPFWGTSLSKMVAIYSLMVLLSAIWGNNLYCNVVCPYGNIQRLLVWLSPFKVGKLPVSARTIRYIQYAVSSVLVGGVIMGMRTWSGFELFPDLFGGNWKEYWFWVALIVVVVSLKYPNLWCRVACPTGCVLSSIQRFASGKKNQDNMVK